MTPPEPCRHKGPHYVVLNGDSTVETQHCARCKAELEVHEPTPGLWHADLDVQYACGMEAPPATEASGPCLRPDYHEGYHEGRGETKWVRWGP